MGRGKRPSKASKKPWKVDIIDEIVSISSSYIAEESSIEELPYEAAARKVYESINPEDIVLSMRLGHRSLLEGKLETACIFYPLHLRVSRLDHQYEYLTLFDVPLTRRDRFFLSMAYCYIEVIENCGKVSPQFYNKTCEAVPLRIRNDFLVCQDTPLVLDYPDNIVTFSQEFDGEDISFIL